MTRAAIKTLAASGRVPRRRNVVRGVRLSARALDVSGGHGGHRLSNLHLEGRSKGGNSHIIVAQPDFARHLDFPGAAGRLRQNLGADSVFDDGFRRQRLATVFAPRACRGAVSGSC
jgi:hypothetical protein